MARDRFGRQRFSPTVSETTLRTPATLRSLKLKLVSSTFTCCVVMYDKHRAVNGEDITEDFIMPLLH